MIRTIKFDRGFICIMIFFALNLNFFKIFHQST